VSKQFTTLNPPAPPKADANHQAQWDEIRSVFPIYLALAKQLQVTIPFAQNKRVLPEKVDMSMFSQAQTWLDTLDQQVMANQLRHLLQTTTLNASESGLRALIMRHLRKPSKSTADRDKIDFLMVQYFALCAPPKIYHRQIELSDVAQVMKPVFGEVNTAPLPWCEPLEKIIQALHGFRSLRDMLKTNFIEQGRRVKESAGGMFYDPSAMMAFVRFNFMLRRTLIELMHADLISIRTGLDQLEAAKTHFLDCSTFGLTANEPITKIRQLTDEWRQPFQKEYTERSVSQAFEKLLALRSGVASSVEKVLGKSALQTAERPSVQQASTLRGGSDGTIGSTIQSAGKAPSASQKSEASGEVSLDFENCLEKIWEQLIAAPPSRGRSMTTVRIGGSRLLMSSWEVGAFVSEDGPAAEDLRRAVVARALITSATEKAKEAGIATDLDRVLPMARMEVSRLQERVEAAKQAKDTEAAVNLGISTKRLLSALDEAEKF
jgi:hypothetical protein